MKQHLPTAHLARASAEHPLRTIGIWGVVLIIAVALIATMLNDSLTTKTTLTNNADSVQANRLLDARLGATSEAIGEVVIVRSESISVDDPAFRSYVDGLRTDLLGLADGIVVEASDYYATGDESLISPDRQTLMMPIVLAKTGESVINAIEQTLKQTGSDADFRALITGPATIEAETIAIAEKDLAVGEGIGISVALVVLALLIGSVAAAILPIVLAGFAIVVALGATTILGQAVDIPFYVTNVISMLGLAVGIDYALFIVSRYREERARGQSIVDAVAIGGATAGRTVLVSGLTVALALIGLLITPDSSNQAIGAGALLVVSASVLAALTLLPALLSLMGDRVNFLRIPLLPSNNPNRRATSGGFWGWIVRIVMRRPAVSVVLASGLLLLAASSYTDLNEGRVGVSALPDGMQSKEAYLLLQSEFGFGQDLPAIVVIDGQTDLPAIQSAIANVQSSITNDAAFVSTTIETQPDANLTILRARLAGDPTNRTALEAVERLRNTYIPTAFTGVPAKVFVTGETANIIDTLHVDNTYTPIVFAFVLGLSFLLLTVAFRSIVVAIKAIVMNLLSIGATYGLLVLVFQKGYGADLLGLQQVDRIEIGLPIFMFAILFGLSMDYHVFLLSRIRERFAETGNNRDAVAHGLRTTGGLISGACLIMVAVFSGFAMGDMVQMQQMGFGLAVAVLLDATIVRCIIVPASMHLLDRWNWYLPSFLHWLPDVHIEGPANAESGALGD